MTILQKFSLFGIIIYFAILLFAVTKEEKNNNVLDYFFGGRKLPFWALSITFIASWWGAGSAIETADLGFKDGIPAFWYYGMPVLFSTFLMIIFSKKIRKIGLLTQSEMMSQRYSKSTGYILAILVFFFMTLNASSQMVAMGKFFGPYLGIENYEWSVIIGTLIVLIYSVFGGFRGVVLTDIIQFVLLIISAFIVFFVTLKNSGGFSNIIPQTQNKSDYFSVYRGFKDYYIYLITFGCAWMIQANVWQRISATKDEKDAKKMTVLSFFVYIPLYLIVVLTGMLATNIFKEVPQSSVIVEITKNYMNPILATIVFIGISAAIMSSMDSLINTAAMTLSLDLYKPLTKQKDEKKVLNFSRIATVIVTILALYISLGVRDILKISFLASDIISMGVFFPLVLGFFWKRGNSKGALASMIIGSIYSFYNLILVLFGENILPNFWQNFGKDAEVIRILSGMLISLLVYVIVSLLTENENLKAEKFINSTK